MPPSNLSICKYKGAGSPQAYILNSSVSPATISVDGPALGAALEGINAGTIKNHANRIVSAFDTRFWIHGNNIYRQNIEGSPGDWESVVTLSPMTDIRLHSGIHLAHPNGVPTLVAMWYQGSGSSAIHRTTSPDGIAWSSAPLTVTLGSLNMEWCGTSLLFGNRIFWVIQGDNNNSVTVDYDLVTGAASRPNIVNIGGTPTANTVSENVVPDILVHQNNLFMWGVNDGGTLANLWRYNGTAFLWIDEILSIEAAANSGVCLFTNTSDPSTIIVAAPDGAMAFFRIDNPLAAPDVVTHTLLSATVNPGVLPGDPSGISKYVDADNQIDVDGAGDRPITYLWHNIGNLDQGQFDLYRWNGDGLAITSVTTGVNIPCVEFGTLNIADGGANRIPTTGARPELEGPPEEIFAGITKWFFRMYGDSTMTAPTVNAALFFNLDSGSPEVQATLVPGSLIIEDNPNPTLITIPTIGVTADSIDDITPDHGMTLYSFETNSTIDNIPEGQAYTLFLDLV